MAFSSNQGIFLCNSIYHHVGKIALRQKRQYAFITALGFLIFAFVEARQSCHLAQHSAFRTSKMNSFSVVVKRREALYNVPSSALSLRSVGYYGTRSTQAFSNAYNGLCVGAKRGAMISGYNKIQNVDLFSKPVSMKNNANGLSSSQLRMSTISSTPNTSGRGFGKSEDRQPSKEEWKIIDVPLVFVPGMKGTHLAFEDDANLQNFPNGNKRKKKRAWLTLSNLLNFPPRPDDDPSRDLSLPLSYDCDPPPGTDPEMAEHYPRQHRGKLVPDGIVDHIIEVNLGRGENVNYLDLNFLPFYGHCTKAIREMDIAYHKLKHDGKLETTDTFQGLDESTSDNGNKGVFDTIGSFVERTSLWNSSKSELTTATTAQGNGRTSEQLSPKICRPTAIFSYYWRRPLPELCTELHNFCEKTFPNQKVQIVAHSLGGLMTFAAMRHHPDKYSPGAVVVGVPFETGIQYLQDLHKGYYTELDRCRQFTPGAQFTMSSHWGFFPVSKKRLEDRFVDVSDEYTSDMKFDPDKSGIGKTGLEFQPAIEGKNAFFDFYNVEEWEALQLGVFGPEFDDKLSDEQREAYKKHMTIQMKAAKAWRLRVLREDERIDNNEEIPVDESFDLLARGDRFPPLVAMATNTIPTVNQILRRKRKTPEKPMPLTRKGRRPFNEWEYDYINGRSVPGDGRIDYDKAFPPDFVSYKVVALDSAHAKQMCWEESGGSWGRVYSEVVDQIDNYIDARNFGIVEEDKINAIQDFEAATAAMSAASQVGSDMPQPQQASKGESKTRNGRRQAIVKSLVSRAQSARDRLRRRRKAKVSQLAGETDLIVATRPRFSFRRRRS